MSRLAIETALHTLLPSHVSGPLPAPLIELTKSILAQSRNRASALKPEEEPARVYACANIACERLKRSLNLPKIVVKPPVQPRVYGKLYAHLNRLTSHVAHSPVKGVAGDSNGDEVNGSSKKRKRGPLLDEEADELQGDSPSRTMPLRPTRSTGKTNPPQLSHGPSRRVPGREESFAALGLRSSNGEGRATETGGMKSSRAIRGGIRHGKTATKQGTLRGPPSWIMIIVRALCAQLQVKSAIPHVLAGIESVWSDLVENEDGKATADETPVDQGYPALIIVILSFVLQRMQRETKQITSTALKAQREQWWQILTGLESDAEIRARVAKTMKSTSRPGTDWEGWEAPRSADYNRWLKRLNEAEMFDSDWSQGIRAASQDHDDEDDVEGDGLHRRKLLGDSSDVDNDDGNEAESRLDIDRGMGYGLGTMRQPALDFLSRDKLRSQAAWARTMRARIDELITEGLADG